METRGSNRGSTLRRPPVASVIQPVIPPFKLRNTYGVFFLSPFTTNGIAQLLNNYLEVLITLEFK